MPAKDMKGKGEGFPGLEVNKNEGQFITHRAWFSLSPESTTAASMVGGPKLFRGRKSWEIRIKSISKRFLEYVVGLLSPPPPPTLFRASLHVSCFNFHVSAEVFLIGQKWSKIMSQLPVL